MPCCALPQSYCPDENKRRIRVVETNEQMEEKMEKDSSPIYLVPSTRCAVSKSYDPDEDKKRTQAVEMNEQMEEQMEKDSSPNIEMLTSPCCALPQSYCPDEDKKRTPTRDLLDGLPQHFNPEEQNRPNHDKNPENQRKTSTMGYLDLVWILRLSLSPIALLLFILMALYSLLRFLYKVTLLFIIVAINTPFAIMYNVSVVVEYHLKRFQKTKNATYWNWFLNVTRFHKAKNSSPWSWSDPRANVAIEVKLMVSDFFKVVAGELLVALSAGIITYFTAPRSVFYYATIIGLVAVFHKWLNEDCLSKTALSCLFDTYGLSPMMFLFSFIGFFDIGCHPIAKCSFVAEKAFLFLEDVPNQANKEISQCLLPESNLKPRPKHQIFLIESPKERNVEQRQSKQNKSDRKLGSKPSNRLGESKRNETDLERGDKNRTAEVYWYPFNGEVIVPKQIEFLKWDAFERGLFELNPRIDCIKQEHGKYILKSFMVLKLRGIKLCEYPVERLELPEDYSKPQELFNFLHLLSLLDGFVTNKMRGRYEHSLTLSQIVEGVEEKVGCKIVSPMDLKFVVAGYTNLQE